MSSHVWEDPPTEENNVRDTVSTDCLRQPYPAKNRMSRIPHRYTIVREADIYRCVEPFLLLGLSKTRILKREETCHIFSYNSILVALTGSSMNIPARSTNLSGFSVVRYVTVPPFVQRDSISG